MVVAAAGGVALVIATNPRSTRSACLTGHARIETLSDLDRRDVHFTPVPTTVERLRRLRQPAGDTADRRAPPVETTTYRLGVRLLAMKRERNHDITLTVSAPSDRTQKMLLTFPATRCGHRTAKKRKAEMRRATHLLVSACGDPTARGVRLAGRAELAGVGLFAGRPGARAGPGGVEIAPVLAVGQIECRRAGAGAARRRSVRRQGP
jgi:hypothetical protein